MTKITEREIMNNLIMLADTGSCEIGADEFKAYAEKKLASLERRMETEKARRAAKAAAADELTETVYNLLTDEPVSAEDLLDKLSDVEDISKGKIVNRLTKLFKADRIVKSKVRTKNEDGKSVEKTMYARA